MRGLVVLFLLGICFVCEAQSKFYVGNGDYSILINQDVTTKHSNDQEGGYVDYYILRENDSFEYMLSITKVLIPASNLDVIYTEDYRKKYLTECGCNILEYKKTAFNNFTGMKFKIRSDLNGSIVHGFSVSMISSGALFNINFLAPESKFNVLAPEYEKILNSLVFK